MSAHHERLLTAMLGSGWPMPPGDPSLYPDWLIQIGVRRINFGREMLAPPADRRPHWERAGRPSLVPPDHDGRLALGLVALTTSRLRHQLGSPLVWRYGYRPPKLNAEVGGASGSDHLAGCAVDLVATGIPEQRALLQLIAGLWATEAWGLSVGYSTAGTRVHLGIWAPRTLEIGRQRQWTYPDGGPERF